MPSRTKDNVLAVLACVALSALFGAVAWRAWSGVLAAHESASEQLQRQDLRGMRTATNIYSYSICFVANGTLASAFGVAALGVAVYVLGAMLGGKRTSRPPSRE